jgi:hypothetical protein
VGDLNVMSQAAMGVPSVAAAARAESFFFDLSLATCIIPTFFES